MQTFTIGSLPVGDFIALDQATYEKFADMLRCGNDVSGKHARKATKCEHEHCEAFRAQGMKWSAPQHALVECDTVSQKSVRMKSELKACRRKCNKSSLARSHNKLNADRQMPRLPPAHTRKGRTRTQQRPAQIASSA